MNEYLTKENKDALEAELKELSGVKRREIITHIEYAKSLGDLSENAEYHSAREEQGKLEERIAQIEHVLKHAVVVARPTDGTVSIGSAVAIQKVGEIYFLKISLMFYLDKFQLQLFLFSQFFIYLLYF